MDFDSTLSISLEVKQSLNLVSLDMTIIEDQYQRRAKELSLALQMVTQQLMLCEILRLEENYSLGHRFLSTMDR